MVQLNGSIIHRRYTLLEQLGMGGMGAVFRTHDILTDNIVALKRVILSSDRPLLMTPDDTMYDFRMALAQEFRMLASLRHPHVIHVLDYGFDDAQQPYYTMDYLDAAHTILDVGQDQKVEVQVSLLVQMLQALAYLHRRGIIHRDLKPANVLVSSGVVKVLDFGLATSSAPTPEDTVVGTLPYIAPEMFAGHMPSAAADLYAVGVMAYELLAGRHPFTAADGTLRLMDVLNNQPNLAPLEQLNSAHSSGLSLAQIVDRLLKKQPAERYHNAYDVIHDLMQAVPYPLPKENDAIRDSFLQAAKFVGRETEMQQLEQALQRAQERQGSAWLISGESGVGKSRLMDELRIHALVSGTLVLRGQAEANGSVPYQLWRAPLRRLLLTTDVTDVDAAILRDLVPDIDQFRGRPTPASILLEGVAYQQRLFGTIISLFQRQTMPILLLLEDIQWSPESLAVLHLLTGIVQDQPLLIVASYSLDEEGDVPSKLPLMQGMRLKRLSFDSIAELSASMLGTRGKQEEIVRYLESETEGNILFLVEVVRTLAEEAGQLEDISRMTLPKRLVAGGVQKMISQRLKRVPQKNQRLLQFAALFGRELDLDVLALLKEDQDLEEWLAICSNCNVIEIHDETWHFSHRKLQQFIVDRIPADQLPVFQRQSAEAFEKVYASAPERAASLAERWRAAQDDAKELAYRIKAGEYALQISAFVDAVEHFERALVLMDGLSASSAERDLVQANLYLKLGETERYLSEYPTAQTHLEKALSLYRAANNAPGTARTLAELADLLILMGEYTRAAQVCEEALQSYRDLSDSVGISRVLDRQGMTQFHQGNYVEAHRLSSESLTLSRSIQDTTGVARALTTLGITAFAHGQYAEAMDYFKETLVMGQASGERRKAALALMNMGSAAGQQSDYPAALRYFEEALGIFRAIGERRGVAMTLDNLGVIADYQKNYPLAHDYFEQSLAMGKAIGNWLGVASTLVNLGNVTQAQKQPQAAADYYRRALQQALAIDAVPTALEALVGLAAVHPDRAQAVQWLGLVLAHPAAYEATRQLAEPVLAAAHAEAPDKVEQWLEQGKALNYEAVVRRLAES